MIKALKDEERRTRRYKRSGNSIIITFKKVEYPLGFK